MKSSFELAMERLNKSSPAAKLTAQQKEQLAELDSKYKAKIAEREIFLESEIAKAASKGDVETLQQLQKQLACDKKNLAAELEEKKDYIRQG
jgi:hypothetical protein